MMMAPLRLLCIVAALIAAASSAAPAHAAPYHLGPAPKERPRRVVTLAPSLTEVVIDLGLAERLVGVTRYDDAKEVEGLPRIGGYLDPSAEAIAGLRPDLLIVQPSPGNRSIVERLAKLGVPVLVVPLGNLEEILVGIREVAKALGEAERGLRLASEIESELLAIGERIGASPKPRVLIVYGWQPLVVAGPGSFADELLRIAGGENAAAAAKGAFPTLPAEAALGMAPSRILDATFGHEGGKPLPGWEGRIEALRSQALSRPGPRLLEAARELASLLHGGAKGEESP